MRYEKPIVINLSTRARFAQGQGPLACVSGGNANAGGYQSCGAGGGAIYACAAGGINTGGAVLCVDGGAADSGGDCYNGTVVQYYCGAGTGGGTDLYGACVAGPSHA